MFASDWKKYDIMWILKAHAFNYVIQRVLLISSHVIYDLFQVTTTEVLHVYLGTPGTQSL